MPGSPARPSVLQQLSKKYAQYAAIQTMVGDIVPQTFRIGAGSRTWLNANKSAIRSAILGIDVPEIDELAVPAAYRSTPAGLRRRP